MVNKKGISPVIATVLLISIALIIGAIIFIWASFFIKENIQKNGESIATVCDRVDLEASISGNTLNIINNGDVPVYKLALNIGDSQNLVVKNYGEINLGSGQSKTIDLTETNVVSITPILKGIKNDAETDYTCDKKQITVSSE